MHIPTHSGGIEAQLRMLFTDWRWEKVHDFECLSANATSWGEIAFGDGVQSRLNPRLQDVHPEVGPLELTRTAITN